MSRERNNSDALPLCPTDRLLGFNQRGDGFFIRGPCTRRNTFRDLDWVSLAKGMGVEARRVDTVDELVLAFRAGVAVKGPFLIEVVL
jgi:thiamine pyrophosphate-dependent acetolactate synthase large subunit-like protein